MSYLTESAIETFALQLFKQQGYEFTQAERETHQQVVLIKNLTAAVRRLNPTIPEHAQHQAIKNITNLHSTETLIYNNETFHRCLTEGVKVSFHHHNEERGDLVWLLDFAHPENNDFLVTNQFTVVENHQAKRRDIILFINGLPLVIIELKNPTDENATLTALLPYKS